MIKNASQLPKRYFGLHFVDGVAEYKEKDGIHRVFINQDTAKKMNTTFEGRPVYVGHVDKVNLQNLEFEKDGVVVKAFYNQKDGKHWVEFMIETDKGHQAIARGWKLSNAYHPTRNGTGGEWNGISYDQEILDGEYEHLAIVEDPRYAESIILTPEQFEEYNSGKEMDLKKFMNEKEQKGEEGMFFKKTKVDNSKELELMSVTLPKSKVEMTVTQIINMADDAEIEKAKKPEERMANGDDYVDCYGGKMKVNDLIKAYNEFKVAADKKDVEDMTPDVKENADVDTTEDEEKKKTNELNKQGKEYYDSLKNAAEKSAASKPKVLMTSSDKAAKGKQLYGSV